MSSPARQQANAANAQLSTGPRTASGQARSSQNARTHGLTARDLIVAAEDRQEFEQLLAEYQAAIAPHGPIQSALFDELVSAAWNLRRIRRIETELCAAASSYLDLAADAELQTRLDRLARHHTRIERTFHRSLRELKALQTEAGLRATLARPVADAAPPLACPAQIAKRTQFLERRDQAFLAEASRGAFQMGRNIARAGAPSAPASFNGRHTSS